MAYAYPLQIRLIWNGQGRSVGGGGGGEGLLEAIKQVGCTGYGKGTRSRRKHERWEKGSVRKGMEEGDA